MTHSCCVSGAAPRHRIGSFCWSCLYFLLCILFNFLSEASLIVIEVKRASRCIGHRLGGSERCATPLSCVVGPNGLLEDTPIFWGEDGALNPLLLDVVGAGSVPER